MVITLITLIIVQKSGFCLNGDLCDLFEGFVWTMIAYDLFDFYD